ncbi:unnamed protein product [Prorocentrum cordatum]|uniref:Uncharacterized protein n=1 Tax=Prorocentrum cordatum TaxID=2364126 RepID=A0ABN9SHG6_9DINO|nr:unnamed protein product [Polarella glacialis]
MIITIITTNSILSSGPAAGPMRASPFGSEAAVAGPGHALRDAVEEGEQEYQTDQAARHFEDAAGEIFAAHTFDDKECQTDLKMRHFGVTHAMDDEDALDYETDFFPTLIVHGEPEQTPEKDGLIMKDAWQGIQAVEPDGDCIRSDAECCHFRDTDQDRRLSATIPVSSSSPREEQLMSQAPERTSSHPSQRLAAMDSSGAGKTSHRGGGDAGGSCRGSDNLAIDEEPLDDRTFAVEHAEPQDDQTEYAATAPMPMANISELKTHYDDTTAAGGVTTPSGGIITGINKDDDGRTADECEDTRCEESSDEESLASLVVRIPMSGHTDSGEERDDEDDDEGGDYLKKEGSRAACSPPREDTPSAGPGGKEPAATSTPDAQTRPGGGASGGRALSLPGLAPPAAGCENAPAKDPQRVETNDDGERRKESVTTPPTAAAGARSLEYILVLAEVRCWHEEGGMALPDIHARLMREAAQHQAQGAAQRDHALVRRGVACAMAAQAMSERGLA